MKYIIILSIGLISSTTHAQTTKQDSIANNLIASSTLRASSVVLSALTYALARVAIKQSTSTSGQVTEINYNAVALVGAIAVACDIASIACLNKAGKIMKRP